MCRPNGSSDFTFSCCPDTTGFLFSLLAGKMASLWLFWPLVLSGLLLPGDFKSIQDGTRTTPAHTNGWKWKAAAEGSNSSSQLLPQDPGKKHTKMAPALTTASRLSEVLQEETFPTEMMTKRSPKKVLPETKKKAESKPLPLDMTVTWPWLLDVTSKPSQAPLSTGTLERDFETPGPLSTRKGSPHSSFKRVTPTLAFLDDLSTASSHGQMDDSGVSTATQELIPHSPRPDTKPQIKRPLIAATSAVPQHLEEILSTSQALVDDTEFSTTNPKHHLDSGRPGLNPRARPHLATATPGPHETQTWLDEMASTSMAFSTRSPRQSLRPSATTQGKRPLADDTSSLIGKCLLAILLLALVAAIFIVCSGVLATMLWRQKRAYRPGQANHTEMVCISSLLSAEKEEEEEEERRRRQSKVKRVQLLGETASETEADNLTLNSFLPEH